MINKYSIGRPCPDHGLQAVAGPSVDQRDSRRPRTEELRSVPAHLCRASLSAITRADDRCCPHDCANTATSRHTIYAHDTIAILWA